MSVNKKRRKTHHCDNCRTLLTPEVNFCPICGQENHELNVPIHYFFRELIDGLFYLETKFLVTVKTLFTKPGQITKDFVNGKRARFVPPLKLYFFVTFFFFLYLNDIIESQVISDNSNSTQAVPEENQEKLIEKFDLDKSIEQLNLLGIQNSDSLAEVLKNLPEKEQIASVYSLKQAAIKKIIPTANSKVSYANKDKILSNLNPADSTILKSISGNLLSNTEDFSLSNEVSQLINLKVFKQAENDSIYHVFEQLTPKEILDKSWELKYKSLNDSLKKYGKGKLSSVHKNVLIESFYPETSKVDSVYFAKAGITKLEVTEYKEKSNSGLSIFGVKVTRGAMNKMATFNDEQIDSTLLKSTEYNKLGNWMKPLIRKTIIQSVKITKSQNSNNELSTLIYQNLIQSITKYISLTMFLMMPIVGLLLLWIFYRQNKYYYEHLIFSIHGHTVLFFFATLEFIYIYYFSHAQFSFYSVLVGLIYFFLALKTVYGQSWLKTFVKFWLVFWSYSFIALFMLGFAAIIGFLTF